MQVGDLVTWVSAGSCLVTVAIGCSLDGSQQSCDEPECCGHQVGTCGSLRGDLPSEASQTSDVGGEFQGEVGSQLELSLHLSTSQGFR